MFVLESIKINKNLNHCMQLHNTFEVSSFLWPFPFSFLSGIIYSINHNDNFHSHNSGVGIDFAFLIHRGKVFVLETEELLSIYVRLSVDRFCHSDTARYSHKALQEIKLKAGFQDGCGTGEIMKK